MKERLLTNSVLILLISLLSTQIGVTQSYQVVVDSLLQLLPAQTTSDARVDLLNEISYAYRRVAPEQTLVYGRLALALADSTGYLKGQSIAAKNIGIGQYLTSAPVDSILSYYYQSIEIAEQIDDYYTQAAVNNNIALVYLQILKNRSAIRHYLRGIEIFEQHIAEDTFLKALMYSNLAGAYNRLGQYERAIQGFEKATKIATAKNYRTIISLSGADYAEALIQLDSIEQAESRFAEALAMQESLGDLRSIARTYNLRANYLLESGRLAEAASLAQQSLNIAIDNKVTRELLFAQVTLAKIALEQQDYAKVIALGSAGIAAGNSIQQEGLQQDMRKLMIVAYRKLGDLERAFVLMDDFEKRRDTLQVRDRAQFTEELEAKFLNIQQQREIDFLNKEKQLDDERIRWLTIFMLLMLLAVIWIATLLRKQNQNNKTIQTKKEELEKYIAYNLQLENFAYIASHDLKTPLRTIVSFSQLLRRSAREKLSADEEEYLRFIIRGTKEMSTLIEDLLSYSKVEKSELKYSTLQVTPFLEHVLERNQAYIQEKSAIVQLDVQVASIQADSTKLQQLLQNLLLNAVKFQQPEQCPKVVIQVREQPSHWYFSVRDNGIGIDPSYFDKIFLVFKRLHQKEVFEGTGIGLAICKKVVDMHGGRIWVESQMGEGANFQFTLPKT